MAEMGDIVSYMKNRPLELKRAKEKGIKIVGYFPGNYVPEEIIYAAGAVPVCLIHASQVTAQAGLAMMPQVICPFARAQLGERLLKENPYYSLLDILVAPITCQHLKKAAEIWEYSGDLDIFKLGVPHQYGSDFEVEYYIERLRALRDRLGSLTGTKVADEKIGKAIEIYNRMRRLFKEISLMRSIPSSAINAADFVKLNHASFQADPIFIVKSLENIIVSLKNRKPPTKVRPRILLIGPNLSIGDETIFNMVTEAGGEIVIEEICEGIRYYWSEVENRGDVFESLARGYLVDRIPCAYIRDSARKRLDFALGLIRDFNISGVIWYEVLGCETYDSESYFFTGEMRKRGIPVLILESDYSASSTGQMRTRIEAFMEILRGGTSDA